MNEADLVNIYIIKLTNEINECTKRRILLEAQLEMANKLVADLTSHNTSLEVENEKLKAKLAHKHISEIAPQDTSLEVEHEKLKSKKKTAAKEE